MAHAHPIYVIDDSRSIRASIKHIFQVMQRECETFGSGEEFLGVAGSRPTGTILIDLRMPGVDGHDVQREIAERGICMPIVFISGHGDVAHAVEALQNGAVHFFEKPFRRDDLLAVIDKCDAIIDDRSFAARDALEAVRKLNGLTPRERQVMNGLAAGYPNKTIAFDLGISARTVEIHRANLMKKLDVRNFAEALRLAFAAERYVPHATSSETPDDDPEQTRRATH